MNTLARIRKHSDRLAQISAGLFVLVWLSIAAAPCAIAMTLNSDDHHDCPHCPPRPCHELEPIDCEAPDSIDNLRAADSSPVLAPPPGEAASSPSVPVREGRGEFAYLPPARAGPRPHLLNAQFNE